MAKTPAKYRVRLSERRVEDLASFIDQRDHWGEIVDAAFDVPAASSVNAFCRYVSDNVNLDFEIVGDVLSAIRHLKLGQFSSGRTSEQVTTDITTALSRRRESWDWSDAKMQVWRESVEEIVRILNRFDKDSSLMLSSKAQRLVFDRSSILRDVRIITDLRPVFDSNAENIREMIVIHTLVIRFEDSKGFKEQYIAIDGDDLEQIQRECSRAAAKSLVSTRSLDDCEWRTVEYPEIQADEENNP